MGCEIISHTADLRIRVWGGDYKELFRSAFKCMMKILKKESGAATENASIKNLKVESADITGLLIDFLNEVLYHAETNREIYTGVKFIKFEETALEARLSGFPTAHFDEDIKAVSYHEAEIKKNPEGLFEARIVFDI